MTLCPKKCDFGRFPTVGLQKKGPKIPDRPCIDQRFLAILTIFDKSGHFGPVFEPLFWTPILWERSKVDSFLVIFGQMFLVYITIWIART